MKETQGEGLPKSLKERAGVQPKENAGSEVKHLTSEIQKPNPLHEHMAKTKCPKCGSITIMDDLNYVCPDCGIAF